ncbi:hypothetical protein LTR36_005086 [Oleoguttula mirabilis]|uniref:Uncharacterized protein n=1 Tax=Oleoguttula mirabilis TaxID=1507867 RepID=A0AAV9JW19_9PEZI|nr:hypothetical protein LTR36_005086 [Oleoguttula mirabilis]
MHSLFLCIPSFYAITFHTHTAPSDTLGTAWRANVPKYEVKQAPGKGKGVFALEALPRGTSVFKEPQVMNMEDPGYLITEEAIEQAFARLSKAKKRRFKAQASYYWSSGPRRSFGANCAVTTLLRGNNI